MESERLELKESWHSECLETICAFANGSSVGKLIIGKKDNGEVVGVQNAKKLLEEIPCTVRNLMNLYPRVEEVTENGKTCIVVTVEPRSTAVDLRGVYYVRSGSSTVRLTGQDMRLFLLEKEGLVWTNLISKTAKLSDISPEAVSTFIKRGQEVKRISSAADPNDIESVLKRYRLMTDDGITNAAAVLFGKDPATVSRAAVTKIGLFAKKGGRPLMEDIIEGPVIFQPDETMRRLLDKYIQPRFRLKDHLTRIEVYQYPPEVLREAVLNSIIHRQYMGVEHTTISVYPDSVEIYNPGSFPKGWTAAALLAERKSKPSNPLIAEVFHDIGAIEAWGVGLSLMRDECKKAGIPEPVYESNADGIRIIFESGPWSDTGEDVTEFTLGKGFTPLEHKVYKAIAEGKYTTSKNMASSLGTSLSTIERATSKLRDLNLIQRIGNNRSGNWELAVQPDKKNS